MTDYYIVRTPDRQAATKLYNVLLDLGQDVKSSRLSDWVVGGTRWDNTGGVAFTSNDNRYMCYITEEQLQTTRIPVISVETFIMMVKPNIGRTAI